MIAQLADNIVKLDRDAVYEIVESAIGSGASPVSIVGEAQRGMSVVGKKFESGEYYLAELILAGEIFKGLLDVLNPYLNKSEKSRSLGKVVIATPQTDIHDLGKNIVAIMLKAEGFEVYDLGVDVPVETIIEKVKEIQPNIVGLSCLLSTAFDKLKDMADELEKAGLRNQVKYIIGGGVTNEQARQYCEADFQTTDVIDGVNYCVRVARGK